MMLHKTSSYLVASCAHHLTYRRLAVSITASEFCERRRRLVESIRQASSVPERPIVIVSRSAQELFSAPDVPYPFRQCSYFRYLTGLEQLSDVVLTIEAQPGQQQPTTTLYFDGRTAREQLWQGPALSEAHIVAVSGIEQVKKTRHVHTDLDKLKASSVVSFDFKQFPSTDHIAELLTKFRGMVPLREHIDALRWIKSPQEQQLMRRTCDIGARAMSAMIARSKGVGNENELVGRLELEARRRGAAYQAYPPVVAAGNRANTIHYLTCNQAINDNDVVLVDAGCDVQGYASDITRVFPVKGQFTDAQRTLCDALNSVQSTLLHYCVNVRPLRLNDLYLAMIGELSKVLLEVGLFPSTLTEHERLMATDKICPHHVSHYLGMDVHDCGSVPRNNAVQPGVVFTVEPGIYVSSDNQQARQELRGIGMRIEDDVLVTEDGIDVLTKHCVRESTNIEQLMQL